MRVLFPKLCTVHVHSNPRGFGCDPVSLSSVLGSEHSIQTTLCSLVGKGRMEKVFKLRMWQHFLIVFINFAAHTWRMLCYSCNLSSAQQQDKEMLLIALCGRSSKTPVCLSENLRLFLR